MSDGLIKDQQDESPTEQAMKRRFNQKAKRVGLDENDELEFFNKVLEERQKEK